MRLPPPGCHCLMRIKHGFDEISCSVFSDAIDRCAAAAKCKSHAKHEQQDFVDGHGAFMPILGDRRHDKCHPCQYAYDSRTDDNESFHMFPFSRFNNFPELRMERVCSADALKGDFKRAFLA